MNNIDTIECLRKAKELCAEGWAQGYENVCFGYVNGCYCVATAISAANQHSYHRGAHLAFEAANHIWSGGVMRWNDDPERTQEDVLKAFDKAIALAEKEALPALVAGRAS